MKQYIRQAQYKKGFVNIVLVVLVVILAGAVGYFVWRQSTSVIQVPSLTESEVIASLKIDWQTVQALIPFRPVYHNQAENAAKIWRTPTAMQFIGKNNLLARFEDDNNVHVAVFNFDGGKFSLLETFQNQGEFTLSDWQNLITKYGATSYSVSTYAKDLMRNGELVSFQDLTKVPENVLLKNYWTVSQNPPSAQPPVTPLPSSPTTCTDQQEGAPVITSLSTYSGSIGTTFEVRGCNFSGFEGDKNVWIENSQGVKADIYGEAGSTSKLLKITLRSLLCQQDNSYSGLPCKTWLTLIPGTYKIYTMPWGKKSNEVNFTVTGDAPQKNPYIKVIDPNGGETWKIGQLYTVLWEAYKVKNVSIEIVDMRAPEACKVTKDLIAGDATKYTFTLNSCWAHNAGMDTLMPLTPGDQYKVYVRGEVSDSSNATFTIVQ